MSKVNCPICQKQFSVKGIHTHLMRAHGSEEDKARFTTCKGTKLSDDVLDRRTELRAIATDKRLGKISEFTIQCTKCNCEIIVRERESQHPIKENYYCSRSCANSRVWSDYDKTKKSIAANNFHSRPESLIVRSKNSQRASEYRHSVNSKVKISKAINDFYKSELGLKHKEATSNRMKHRIVVKESTKKKLSESAIKRGFGGVRPSSRIKYNGVTLGSSYELTLVKDLDLCNIRWTTCQRFTYVNKSGKTHTYTPDIYLIDHDIFVDPKNDFLINNINPALGFCDLDKIAWVEEQNNIKVIVLSKSELSWSILKSKIDSLNYIVS